MINLQQPLIVKAQNLPGILIPFSGQRFKKVHPVSYPGQHTFQAEHVEQVAQARIVLIKREHQTGYQNTDNHARQIQVKVTPFRIAPGVYQQLTAAHRGYRKTENQNQAHLAAEFQIRGFINRLQLHKKPQDKKKYRCQTPENRKAPAYQELFNTYASAGCDSRVRLMPGIR